MWSSRYKKVVLVCRGGNPSSSTGAHCMLPEEPPTPQQLPPSSERHPILISWERARQGTWESSTSTNRRSWWQTHLPPYWDLGVICSHDGWREFIFVFFLCCLHVGFSQAEEKKVLEKTLQSPLLPSPVADHVKCNILKAQLENASRGNAQVGWCLWCSDQMPPGSQRRTELLCQSQPARRLSWASQEKGTSPPSLSWAFNSKH